ncbi:MAG: hypothetical protein Q7R93_00930 [bacterium]|nr:hypothetical protein [bacterium]
MKKENLLLTSFFAIAMVAGAHGFANPYLRSLIEEGVRWCLLGCLFLLPLLLLRKSLTSIQRVVSRLRLKRAQQRLWHYTRSFDCKDRHVAHLNDELLRCLTRHISDYVDDAYHPDVAYYRYYANGIRERLSKYD